RMNGGRHKQNPKGIRLVCDADFAREGLARLLKVSNPSLGHLASHARIAIQISKISREQER
ncbi:MAG TPA: hypothetical protein VNY53_16115, partial [Bradyrhizobium sp.]|nr:hypothetical protein [Bradyrhizobium sp.]